MLTVGVGMERPKRFLSVVLQYILLYRGVDGAKHLIFLLMWPWEFGTSPQLLKIAGGSRPPYHFRGFPHRWTRLHEKVQIICEQERRLARQSSCRYICPVVALIGLLNLPVFKTAFVRIGFKPVGGRLDRSLAGGPGEW